MSNAINAVRELRENVEAYTQTQKNIINELFNLVSEYAKVIQQGVEELSAITEAAGAGDVGSFPDNASDAISVRDAVNLHDVTVTTN